jgi:hypothetical protein
VVSGLPPPQKKKPGGWKGIKLINIVKVIFSTIVAFKGTISKFLNMDSGSY